jgi:osmotically-inducible protein OsmY
MSLTSKLVLASALALGAAPAVAAADSAPAITAVQQDRSIAPKQAQDTSDYAQREAADKQVESYQGGSTVVIGISGGALLVLLFLLLIL